MAKKPSFLILVASILVSAWLAEARQPDKIPRVGYVSGRVAPSPSVPDLNVEAFRQGLRDLGYIEGKNIIVEYRYVGGDRDRITGVVTELLQTKVDVLVSPVGSVILTAKQTTRTIPIVMVTTRDPVLDGIVTSLARPGGNITGIARLHRDLSGKRLELLKETVPGISRVGVLWDPSPAAPSTAFKEYENAARALKIQIQSLEVQGPNADVEGAFRAAVKGNASAIITTTASVLVPYSKKIADLALKNRLPSMHERITNVAAGGLMSYSTSDTESYRRAAYFVDKILKGANPATLPVEQPVKFELVINLKTAKQIGVTIPQSVLYRADRVIR